MQRWDLTQSRLRDDWNPSSRRSTLFKDARKLEEENKALHESNRNLNEENKSLRARVQGLERGFNSLVGHLTLTPHALKASDTADSNGQV